MFSLAEAHHAPTAVRAATVVSAVSEDYVSRRVKHHLNDLERSNYTEPTSGPSTYGAGEDGEEKAPTALGKPGEEDGQGASAGLPLSLQKR